MAPLHIKRLWYLGLVVSQGSFAAAARAAGVSQPAISAALGALESELGQPLFEKAGRHKRPTPFARTVAAQVSELMARFEAVVQVPGAAPPSASRRLRLGMAPAAALLYGPAIAAVWRVHEPMGTMQIGSGAAPDLLSSLEAGTLDLVVAPRPRRYLATGVEHQALHTSQPTVWARAGHPLSSPCALADIAQAGWAVAGSGGTPGNVIEEALRVRHMPAPQVLLQCADYRTLIELVADSDLLCVLPHPALLPDALRDRLKWLQIPEGLPQYEVCVFWRRDFAHGDATLLSALVDALRALRRD